MSESLESINAKLPFSLACFLCAEKMGYSPDCEQMNATYTHSEKKKMFIEKGYDENLLPDLLSDSHSYIFLNKPCQL